MTSYLNDELSEAEVYISHKYRKLNERRSFLQSRETVEELKPLKYHRYHD